MTNNLYRRKANRKTKTAEIRIPNESMKFKHQCLALAEHKEMSLGELLKYIIRKHLDSVDPKLLEFSKNFEGEDGC